MDATKILLESLQTMMAGLIGHLPQLAIGVFILLLTWSASWVARAVLNRTLKRSRLRRSLVELFMKLVHIGIWVIGILATALVIFPTLTPAKVLTAIGLGSVAIGFAFKDIFENFLAGVLILLREPFQLDDYIECQDIEGFVEDITIRDTHVRKLDGQRVVMPNAMLFKNAVYVRTDWEKRRTDLICGIAYDEDVDSSREIIRDAINSVDGILKNPEPVVTAHEFGASSIDFRISWWTQSKPSDVRNSRDKAIAAVKRALDEAGVEIPFPYRTLTFKEPLPLQSGASDQH